MKYVSLAEAAVQFRLPVAALHWLCEHDRLCGAVRFGRVWTIPESMCLEELAEQLDRSGGLVDISGKGA